MRFRNLNTMVIIPEGNIHLINYMKTGDGKSLFMALVILVYGKRKWNLRLYVRQNDFDYRMKIFKRIFPPGILT